MPILDLTMAMIPLKMNLKFPMKAIDPNPGVTSYAIVNCRVTITAIKMESLHCDGSICNGTMLVQTDGGVNPTKCACYSKRGKKVCIAGTFDATFDPVGNGDSFQIKKCVDIKCQSEFFINSGNTRSLKADDLNNSWDAMDAIENAFSVNTELVNNNGGWDVVLWHKQGLVADAVDRNQNPGYGQEQQMIANSELKLHFVRMMPHSPERLNQEIMDGNRVELSELLAVQNNDED